MEDDTEDDIKDNMLDRIIRLCAIIGVLFWFISTFSTNTCFDMEQIKEEQFWLIIKKAKINSTIHKILLSGENICNKDTAFYTDKFSHLEVKVNDTIVKNKGEIYYEIKSDEFITKKIYLRDNRGCKVDIEKKERLIVK